MCKQVEVLLVMPVVGDCARCVPGVLISCCAAVVVFYRQRLSRTSGQHRVAVFQNYATRPGGHPAVHPACLADWWFRSCGVVGIGRVHPCALKARHVQHLGILNMHRGCWETSQALVCSTVFHTVMLCRCLVKSESKVASIVNDPSNSTSSFSVSLQS